MDYSAYSRPRGSNGETSYFGGRDPDYTSTSSYSAGRESHSRRRTSPPNHDGMTAAPDRVEPSGYGAVPPEIIAAITEQVTEKVKRELVDHLKQTGSIDDQLKADPMQRQTSNRSSSTSSPLPTMRRVYTPPSPSQSSRTAYAPPPSMEHTRSPPRSPPEKPNAVRFSDREPRARPARTFSTADLSTIDQKWGRLVDSEGTPTQRLGQFLRGLANHIIDDFQPKKSIVVTPEKMAAYYSRYSLQNEPHPLLSIFRAQANEQISLLYRDLGCQHFFVQEDAKKEPVIPALTPLGFAHWMTMSILAYPEEESERLGKVVLDLPIDADGQMVDGKPERLPKQLSRHLLPAKEDWDSKVLVDSAMASFLENLGTTRRRKGSIESPPTSRGASTSQRTRPVEVHQTTKTSPTVPNSPHHERERKPYSGEQSNSSDNGEPVKIERERQPYTAQPGSGKVYADSTSGLGRAASTSSRRKNPESQGTRHNRTQSTSSNHCPPPPPRTHNRRTSSPPLRNFSHSTPTDIDAGGRYAPPPPPSSTFSTQLPFGPSSYGSGSSTSFPPPPPPIDIRSRRSRDDRDYSTRTTDDEARFMGDEFNSPRDAERWDRYHESRSGESDRFDKPYERGSVTIDPVDLRGVPAEDWYRDKGRGQGYYGPRSGY
ncbi:uncharacterized protein BP5553_03350 [Venustampulla echinocandica]|uniref:DUF7514 domain-containing protein n=1 Tax=Venustampulla echinocandica TaxID=2656787 RepID=A0A370TU26_9HELO|nr:uncharacterized protein BP5553_03350 [Venustampulla echinocandica]RDL39010.1 hypothetical protein BP5553_03350 [Venustampulla echinocandica]